MPAAATRRKPLRSSGIPLPRRPWTDDLLQWKIDSLSAVLEQLNHLCSSPKCRPKSFSLNVAVRHVVAEIADPDSGLGLHLQHLLTGAIAQEIVRRTDLADEFHRRFPARKEIEPAFLPKYVNSRWWCEVFCQIDSVCCRDLMAAVEGSITSARAELG